MVFAFAVEIFDYYYNAETPTMSLAASYDFSEGSGSTLADGSGNSNDATITGATWSPIVPFGSAGRTAVS